MWKAEIAAQKINLLTLKYEEIILAFYERWLAVADFEVQKGFGRKNLAEG